MLLRSEHQHIALFSSLEREHRLVLLQGDQSGGAVLDADDDAKKQKMIGKMTEEEFAELQKTSPSTAERIWRQHVQEERKKAESAERKETEGQSLSRAIGQTKASLKMKGDIDGLMRRIEGEGAHIISTLVHLIGEKELQKLAGRVGVNLTDITDAEKTVEEICKGRTADVISAAPTWLIAQMTHALRSQLDTIESLRRTAATKFIDGGTEKELLTDERRGKLRAKEEKLALEVPKRGLQNWIQVAPISEIAAELGIPKDAVAIYRKEPNRLRNIILSAVDAHHRLELGYANSLRFHPEIKKVISGEKSLSSLSGALAEQVKSSMTLIGALLRERMREEATKTQAWLDNQQAWYETKRKKLKDPRNDAEADAAFLADPSIGVSAIAIKQEMGQIQRVISAANSKEGPVVDAGFISIAQKQANLLVEYRELGSTGGAIAKPLRKEQEAADDWAVGKVDRIDDILNRKYRTPEERQIVVDNFGGKIPLFESLWKLREMLSGDNARVNAAAYPRKQRQETDMLLQILEDPRMMKIMQQERERGEAAVAPTPILDIADGTKAQIEAQDPSVLKQIQSTRDELNGVIGNLLTQPLIQLPSLRSIGVQKHVLQRQDLLAHELDMISHDKNYAGSTVSQVKREIATLDAAADDLQGLHSNPPVKAFDTTAEFFAATGETRRAFYDYKTRTVYIDREKCGADFDRVLRHELSHATLDRLIRGTDNSPPVFPFLIRSVVKTLQDESPALLKKMIERGEQWGQDEQDASLEDQLGDDAMAKELKLERIVEEALHQNMDLEDKRATIPGYDVREDPDLRDDADWLDEFGQMDLTNPDIEPEAFTDLGDYERGTRFKIRDLRMFDDDEGMLATMMAEAGEDEEGEGGEKEEEKGFSNVRDDLKRRDHEISMIEEFAGAYPQYSEKLGPAIDNFRTRLEIFSEAYNTGYLDGIPVDSESEIFKSEMTLLKNEIEEVQGQINEADNVIRDLSDEKPKILGFTRMWRNVAWLSVLDIIRMGKDLTENLVRIYERNSAHARSHVGAGFFGIFSPLETIPGLGKYIGRLESEFERTKESKEQEEVQVWQDSYKTKDAWEIIESLKNSRNKDQVKGLMFLLAEKGRIPWNDPGLWRTLSYLSSYEMPIEACKRDSLLRDQWLQKLCADIWDRDQYLDWFSSHNSNYGSQKDKYTNQVDKLAQQTNGGMQDVLAQQLEAWVTAKRAGVDPPENVNPHMFEEIVDYAMRNGKMSMQGKFYYLIRGVAEGLLSVDRISVLNGKVLKDFPFIDFFSLHNNSLPEIKKFARMITDSSTSFKPGAKMHVFTQLVIAHDQNAKQRVSKVMGQGGDGLDHEDYPTIAAMIDYKGWDQQLKPRSGQIQRVTDEGIKNTYTGYNTIFKTYGILAQLHKKGEAKFTTFDAYNLANKLVAYLHFDNIITDGAQDKNNRPKLSWHEINHEPGPSGGGNPPKVFRDKMNAFAYEAMKTLDIKEVNGVDIQNDYVGHDREDRPDGSPNELGTKKKEANFNVTKVLVERVQQAILQDPEKFMNLLIKSVDTFQNEGPPLQIDDVRKVFAEDEIKKTRPGANTNAVRSNMQSRLVAA